MANKIDHLAIIMDGNGRWAKGRGLSRLKGHEAGAQAARKVVEAAKERQIRFLTLYAFSSENWRRPGDEVEGLFRLLEGFIDREVERLVESGIRLYTIGDLSRFPSSLGQKINMTIEKTQANSELHLSVALNYGGRDEILRGFRRAARSGVSAEELDEEAFSRCLDTSFMPDPDLLVRTGGERRISNFLLWQLAYTEIYFTDTLWPDFDENALDAAISWFNTRQRRFGMTPEQVEGIPLP
ncbi:MAG: polyprenyl diphosphate synthase [Desulfomonilia bacterium]|jgi:undecaprenyl diphosphate synthase|uniref:Undecaprenyl pyrophosphate synthase n=1 Tax=anaerobic digester metagenome TaxID=1263854 RepID=A0A485LTX6_9ZZZZ|nr:polyprenyl diphosphate synthase [Pseudomonadota bacterium]HPD22475.1 polyprenyl diphosphate synthase [Deltaproteobacteria bacterium]HPX19509.1 polyprenyl diphosphate synthase [Deltaproteobacteria bacterium]HRS57340.1 polyprenyl diphosphate synthase [Desulfomonilia bacterium]HRV36870.1 polyprenyl diphosphate synthase [Desulfomonilia bacterium]